MERLIISAPFGSYFSHEGATSTLGTFTLHNRGGLLWRLWRCALTLRYHRHLQAWTNRLGLPNPGIQSLAPGGDYSKRIISVYGFTREEWFLVADSVARRFPLAAELNLSCPNLNHSVFLDDAAVAVDRLLSRNIPVIAKLPPVRPLDFAIPMWGCGVRTFHACNTLPVPAGGMSGKPLKQLSLWAVRTLKDRWGNDATVIGGGGVTCEEDVRDYLSTGADHVAVGSMLLNPFNRSRLSGLCAAARAK